MKKWMFFYLVLWIMVGCQSLDKEETNPMNESSEKVAGDIEATLTQLTITSPIQFVYEVKNQSEKYVAFTFPTGQTFEHELRNENGELIERYSDGKMFTQAVRMLKLAPGKSFTHMMSFDLEPGTYTLTVWLTCYDETYPRTATFTVR
ncbi:BsuPI-related putative proteinase inhibitor [Aeribacillus pallidus]|uniref:BsuPI-related putative proteinase inhibitor n=1 Tax=Aeribacillus pallidus TaxID=33936 RepID=UPI003D257256